MRVNYTISSNKNKQQFYIREHSQ